MSEIFDFIDKNAALVTELQRGLTSIPAISPESGGEGELDKALWLENWLKTHGFTEIERIDAADSRAKGGKRPNIVVTIPGKAEKNTNSAAKTGSETGFATENSGCLWIMSHIDVVPPGERALWESDPYTLMQKGDRLIGRGVEDNQQAIVCSILAIMALKAAKKTPQRTVKLLFVSDEECGSVFGARFLAEKGVFGPNDEALVPDSGDSLGETIEIAEKTMIRARFHTTGKQSHASRPDLGVNACTAGCNLAVNLERALKNRFKERNPLFDPAYSTFEITKKEANVPNINTIPGDDVFYMDMRVVPEIPVEEVRAVIDAEIRAVEAGFAVKVEANLIVDQSPATSGEAPLVKHLSQAITAVTGRKPRCVGIGGGTVAAVLRNAGLDAAVWACIDDVAHSPNEYSVITQTLLQAKVMAVLALGSE